MSTNSSEPLVPNTIRYPVRHAFSDFFYTQIYICTPPQKANLHIDTGSSITWVQGKECQTCFPVSIPNFDGKQSTTCRAMLANNPLCVLPATGLAPISWSMLMALPLRVYLDLRNLLSYLSKGNKRSQMVYGVREESPHQYSTTTKPTLQRFSYCLPQQFESQPSLLHFGNDAEIRGGTNVFTTPILGAPNDHYYVRLNATSFNGKRLQIDPNLFSRGGSGIINIQDLRTLIVDDAFNIFEPTSGGLLSQHVRMATNSESGRFIKGQMGSGNSVEARKMAGQLLRRSCGRLVGDPCVHTRCARQNAALKLSASVSSSRQPSHALLQLPASVAWSKY
ncbi:PREDICTED: aspartic ase [Prunus dulcis]|uniref:PREDICTED: aspartic ase n=1 Tax=Prunus dulcis TaxID=3755 RepID=A0A5E4FYD8_PRUDU|nr:hypothetical protein L3X38_027023 [Prunus dulcis]VVA32413.1 PREDICTED: aspartic ase [Prunus dulcis]